MTEANDNAVSERDDASFLFDLAKRMFENLTPAMGFDQGDTDRLFAIVRGLRTPTASAGVGMDDVRTNTIRLAMESLAAQAAVDPPTFYLTNECGKAVLAALASIASADVVEALAKSHSYSGGIGPNTVTLSFHSLSDRNAFIDAHVASIQRRAALRSTP